MNITRSLPALCVPGAILRGLAPVMISMLLLPARLLALGGNGAPEIDPSLLVAEVFVNPATGNDGNDGSAAAPRRTLYGGLLRAAQFNAANQGVTVHLAPGTYLEGSAGSHTAMYFPGLSTTAPVVVQGQGWSPGVNTGNVILTGSEMWTSWTSDGGGVWSKPWPYQMRIEPSTSFGDVNGTIVPEVVRLMSGLFVNDTPYYMFRSASDPDMARMTAAEGAYWIDLGPDGVRGGGDDRLRIKPPATLANLNDATVQVTTRGHLLHFWRPSAQADIPTSVVFRNLVVQHSGASGLIFQNHGGVILEDMVFRDNKWRGVTIESPNMPATVRRSVFTGNGEQTIATRGTGMLYEDLLIRNNARQSWLVQYIGWGTGAFKIGFGRDTTFRRIRSLDNWGLGAWFDTGCLRCELVDSVIAGNANTALFIENNNSWNIPDLDGEPTVVVHNSAIINNRRPAGESGSTPGIQIGETENAVVRHSLVAGNDVQVRMLSLLDRGPQRNNQLHDNIFASTNAAQPLWTPQWGVAGWRTWFDTLNATTDRNSYVHPNASSFRDRNASDSLISLAAWKSAHLNNPYSASANKAVDAESTHTVATHTVRPFVSIAPLRDYLSETAGATSAFRVFRLTADLSAPLTVNYTIRADAGDALNGSDHVSLPGSVTIPAGALFADIELDPHAGDGPEPLEPVCLTLAANPTIYQLGRATATLSIDDENGSLASIAVTASRPLVGEASGGTGQWTFTRTGASLGQLAIQLAVSGTATAGVDFAPLPVTVTFAAGSSQAALDLTAIDDAVPELSESVGITVQPQAGLYGVVSGHGSATITITDNDVISLAAVNQVVASGASPVSVPVTLHNPGSSAATFTISPPDQPYTWGASTLLTAPAYEWVEIIDNADPAQNGETIPGPGAYVNYDNPAGFTDGMFTWTTWYTNGYSGGWYRNPLPNNSGEAARGAGTLPLGFTFPFYGQNHSSVFLHSNGFLAVVDDPAGFQWSSFNNRVKPVNWHAYSRGLPSSDEASYPTPRGAISALWNDMTYIHNESRIARKAFPERFVVTWSNMGFRNDLAPYPNRFTFQAILYQNGDIDYQYQRIDRPSGSTPGTVGLTNPDISRALLVSYNDSFITNGLRVRLSYQPTWASASATTVTIPAGGSATFSLILNPANLADGIHSLQVPITSSNPLQPPILLPVTLGVGNLAGSVQFRSATASVQEDAGVLEIPVERIQGQSGAVTVAYRIATGGTASAGSDFSPISGTLVWSDGDSADKTLALPIVDDFVTDGDETLFIELYDPAGGAALGGIPLLVVTIRDNDQPVAGTLGLSATAATPQQINLSWAGVSNHSAFRVERSGDGGLSWTTLAAGLPASTSIYQDTGLVPATDYHYRVRAYNPLSATAWVTTTASTEPAGSLLLGFAEPLVFENHGSLAATVTRSGSTANALTVYLTSNSPRAVVPASVLIPAGQASAGFSVTLVNDAAGQAASEQVIITANAFGTFARDSFEYPAAALLAGQDGGEGWTVPWQERDTPRDFTMLANGLNYPGWGGGGGYAEGSLNADASAIYRDLLQPLNRGAFYFGLLVQYKPGTYPSDVYFGFDNGDHTWVNSWMDLRFRITSAGVLEYTNQTYPAVWIDTGLRATGNTNQSLSLVVGKIDFGANNAPGGGNDSIKLWMNPAAGDGEPAPGFTASNLNLITIARFGFAGWWKDARIDELRFANDWSGLTGTAASGLGQFTLRDDENLAGIELWRDIHWSTALNTGSAADQADPDMDGLNNLLEYALGLDPHGGALPGELPEARIQQIGDLAYLTLSFRQRADATALVYEVESSADLSGWSAHWSSAAAANSYRVAQSVNSDGTVRVTVRDTEPVSAAPRRFLRLRVHPR